MKLRIFCDFDGTVAKNDVGNLVFTTFGDARHWWHLVDEWKNGKIEGRELWRRQAQVAKMTPEQLDDFASTQPLDPAFPEFVRFCRQQRFPIYVVSDGMDAYIKRILAHHGLDDLMVRANHLEMLAHGSLEVSFPYFEIGCGKCANCKGSHIVREKQPDETTIFIGDGYSDICALAVADITFAKGDLLHYCRDKGMHCRPFETFADVQREIEAMILSDAEKQVAK